MSRARTLAPKLGVALASLLLSLGAGELLLRWSSAPADDEPRDDAEWRARYRRMNETLYRRSDDRVLVYEPRPGASVEMEYGAAAFNSAGMRDDREYRREGSSKRRVALLGDSLVWSEFTALESSLGRAVEAALGSGHEVLNFGVTGYDTEQEVRWYERAVRPFRPETLVLVYCMNDMMIMSGPYNLYADAEERRRKDEQDRMVDRVAPVRRETIDELSRREEAEARLLLLARARTILRRLTFESSYVDEHTVMAADAGRVEATRAALARLGADLDRDGVRGVLVISPVLESWDRYHWSHIHRLVGDAAGAAGFVVVDPLARWRAEHGPARLRVPGDNLHYSPRGYRALGAAIAEALGSPSSPGPAPRGGRE